jgi:hypothetical protein
MQTLNAVNCVNHKSPNNCDAGSPRYFSPLLHLLRSGELEIPPGVSHTSLQREAEFYGLSSVVFKLQEEEKRKREAKDSESNKSHLYL